MLKFKQNGYWQYQKLTDSPIDHRAFAFLRIDPNVVHIGTTAKPFKTRICVIFLV